VTAKDIWDAKTYLQFEGERLRPALDLIARIPHEAPKLMVDLGCGAGDDVILAGTVTLADVYALFDT